MPDGPFDKVEDALDAWAKAEKILPIEDYQIVKTENESEEPHTPGTGVVLVHTLINGEPHSIRVALNERLTWVH
jgi:hypothetical protein